MFRREEDKKIKLLHHEMLNRLSDEIYPEMGNPWKKLLNMLKVYLSSKEISGATDIFNVCEILEIKKEIEYGQYGVLKKLFSGSGLQKCCEIVEQYSKLMEETKTQISATWAKNKPTETGLSRNTACDLPIRVDIASENPPSPDKSDIYDIIMNFLKSVLDDILKQSDTPEEKLTRFDQWLQRYERVTAKRKCLMLYVRCKSIQALDDLWRIYKSGELLDILQNGLVTRDVLRKSGMKSIELMVFISEEDYERCLNTIGGDLTKQKAQARNKGDNQCALHQSDVTLSCTDCGGELVCDVCKSTLHFGHQFVEISKIAAEKKIRIEEYLKKAKRKEQIMKERLKYVDEKTTESLNNFKRLENEIIMHGQNMKADIDRITQEFVQKNSELQQENLQSLSECKQAIEFGFSELIETMDICKKLLASKNKIMLIDTDINLKKELNFSYAPNLKIAQFDAGQGIEDKFGAFRVTVVKEMEAIHEVIPRPATKYDIISQKKHYDATVLSELTHSGFVISVEKSTAEGIWISSEDSIYLVNQQGKILDILTMGCAVQDISVSSATGNLWFCSEDVVYEVLDKNLIERFTTDSFPWRLCMTPGNNVVVGIDEKLTVYNTTGQVLHTTSKSGKKSVIEPFNIAVCANTGDIAVCDNDGSEFGGENRPRVYVFNSKLQPKYKYFGLPLLQDNSPTSNFHPVDAVYDSQDCLLIADSYEKCIQMVDGAGQFLTVVYTDQLLEPIALTLIDDGLLFVCFGTTSKIIRYGV